MSSAMFRLAVVGGKCVPTLLSTVSRTAMPAIKMSLGRYTPMGTRTFAKKAAPKDAEEAEIVGEKADKAKLSAAAKAEEDADTALETEFEDEMEVCE